MAENTLWKMFHGCLVFSLVVVGMVFLVQIFSSEVEFGVILAFVVLTSYWVFSLLFTEETISSLESIRGDGSDNNISWENLQTILAFTSTVVGMVFLTLSSFSEEQSGGENHRFQCVLVVIFTSFFVANIFLRKNINKFLESICGRYLSTKEVVQCISFAVVSMLTLLIKYPRFNIRSPALTTSCIHEDQEINEIFRRILFRLYFFGAFSLLTFLVSPKGQESVALKVSSWLLGLTIETSMEIPGRDGPNLRYMFGTATFCIFLILLKHHMESGQKIFKFLYGAVVFFCLIYFLDSTFFVEYLLFSLLGSIICIEMKLGIGRFSDHHNERKTKASLNIFLLLITGILIISNKDDRFQIESKLKKICADQEKVENFPHGSQYNLYSAAAFSLYALVISFEKDQSMELGIFDFLLQLTMDASIDLTTVWYIVGASPYCVLLIFARIYLAPTETRHNSNV